MDTAHAGLAALPSFGHALGRFQAVDVVGIDAAVTDTNALAHRSAVGNFHRRNPPRHRQRRAGEKGEAQPLRRLDHGETLPPIGGEMLVVEYGHGAAAVLKYLHSALEELVARIKGLALFGAWINSVLGDDQDTIHREFRSPKCKRLLDTGKQLHFVSARPLAAQIAFGKLIHVKPGQLEGRSVMLSFPAVTFQETIDEMLRVGVFSHLRGQDGDFRAA